MSGENEINTKKRDFDQGAAKWDQVPGRVKVARDIAQSMLREITLTPDMDVLDFGCGTGLLTFALQPFVRSITGVDSSYGMLDVFKTKIKEQKLGNVKADYLDLDKGDFLTGSYHLVISSMTLHHIKNISTLLKQFYSILFPSGQLAIADLDLDDGEFHGNNDGVFHFGFNREELRLIFMNAGFQNIQTHQAAEIEKPAGDGKSRLFTIFLMTARKSWAWTQKQALETDSKVRYGTTNSQDGSILYGVLPELMSGLANRFGISVPAVSKSVVRGLKIAEQEGFSMVVS